MNEEFLHYIWKYRLFTSSLYTLDAEEIEILSSGIHNHNAGPDFSDARLRIGNTIWAGNVEIHINTSDWFRHGHQHDPAYENVVLHVVFNHDSDSDSKHIPILEIKNTFDNQLFLKYKEFLSARRWVPCVKQLFEVPKPEIALWLERMLIERLERKADFIQGFLALGNNNWEEALYHTLARSFGFSINALPFEMVARSLPYTVVSRHSDNPMQIEALIFGQAGMLTQQMLDPWSQQLFQEYSFLRKKYQLVPIDVHLWKFMRLRPVNFPTIRLAQFAAFVSGGGGLLSRVIECKTIAHLQQLFQNVVASSYWDSHFQFDKPTTPSRPKHLGNESIALLLINAVLPFLFVYGQATDNDVLCNRALDFFSQLPGESNSIIQNWKEASMDVSSAFNTQALIGLKQDYCDKKRCLDCRIGNYLLRKP